MGTADSSTDSLFWEGLNERSIHSFLRCGGCLRLHIIHTACLSFYTLAQLLICSRIVSCFWCKQIIYIGNPLLRATSTAFSEDELKNNVKELQKLALTMRDTLREAGGVGLAAPQVALSRRVFVAECNGSQIMPGPLPFLALFNPVVDTSASQGKDPVRVQEGCLSVPDMRAVVPRPCDVTVTFFDIFEQRQRRIRATGCLSSIWLMYVHSLNLSPFFLNP